MIFMWMGAALGVFWLIYLKLRDIADALTVIANILQTKRDGGS